MRREDDLSQFIFAGRVREIFIARQAFIIRNIAIRRAGRIRFLCKRVHGVRAFRSERDAGDLDVVVRAVYSQIRIGKGDDVVLLDGLFKGRLRRCHRDCCQHADRLVLLVDGIDLRQRAVDRAVDGKIAVFLHRQLEDAGRSAGGLDRLAVRRSPARDFLRSHVGLRFEEFLEIICGLGFLPERHGDGGVRGDIRDGKSRTLYVAVVRAVGYRIRNAAIRKRITDDAAVCSTRVIILAGYRAAVRAVIYSRSSTAVSYLCIYL